MKKTAILLILGLLFSFSSFADEEYGPPLARCLNKHTFPFIKSDRSALEIVTAAYKACDAEVRQWDEDRKSLPEEMVASQNKELRDLYLRMIDIRRQSKHAF